MMVDPTHTPLTPPPTRKPIAPAPAGAVHITRRTARNRAGGLRYYLVVFNGAIVHRSVLPQSGTAFVAGAQARIAGAAFATCPFIARKAGPWTRAFRLAWEDGWRAAHRQLDVHAAARVHDSRTAVAP